MMPNDSLVALASWLDVIAYFGNYVSRN